MADEQSCLFCLEIVKPSEKNQNIVGCQCQLVSHGSCLEEWFQQKNQIECPICHAISIPNPISTPQREVIIIHVNRPQEEDYIGRFQRHDKCIGLCCVMILMWWIGGIAIQQMFG